MSETITQNTPTASLATPSGETIGENLISAPVGAGLSSPGESPPALPTLAGAGTAPPASFERLAGETPRAFSAFMHFFQLGHGRSLPLVAEQLEEHLSTIKKWSTRFQWNARILSFNSGRLRQHADTQAAMEQELAADWSRRTRAYREHEWETAQKLLGAVQCFLDSFGDRDVERMTLAQVSRAFQISSSIARQALSGTAVADGPILAPLQLELAAALKKAYANPPTGAESGNSSAPGTGSAGVSPAVPGHPLNLSTTP